MFSQYRFEKEQQKRDAELAVERREKMIQEKLNPLPVKRIPLKQVDSEVSLEDMEDLSLSPQEIAIKKKKSKSVSINLTISNIKLTVIDRNDNLGRSYRNRVATFI